MEAQNKVITVELSDGTNVKVEATLIGERKLSVATRPFNEVTVAIESLTKEIAEVIQKVKPDKASVKFGIEIAIEQHEYDQSLSLIQKGILYIYNI